MTTAEYIHSIATSKTPDVTIAGVPWPRYKVVALIIGFAVALIVGVVAGNAGPAVLAGAAAGILVWLSAGAAKHLRAYVPFSRHARSNGSRHAFGAIS